MSIENQISEIFVDFVEIFDKINYNGYSDHQKHEMMELFESQTIKKCLEFIFSSKKFVKDITAISDLVLTVIQKLKITNFESKECFLRIFDEALSVHDETYRIDSMKEAFNGEMEYVVDEIKEVRKKCDFLESENHVLREEIDEKSASLAKIETLYIKLKYDYYKLNVQSETMNEDQAILRNKISDINLQKELFEERQRKELLGLVEELENLRKCVAERDIQICELEEEEEKLSVSSELMKLEVQFKNRLIADMKNQIEDFEKHQCDLDTSLKQYEHEEESNPWANVVPGHNLRTSNETDNGLNIVHKLLSDKNDATEKYLVDSSFALEETDVKEFRRDEIEFCSTRKSLSEELLGAWNAIGDDDDALEIEHDDPIIQRDVTDFFGSLAKDPKPWNLDSLNSFEDSGFHQGSLSETISIKNLGTQTFSEPTEEPEKSKRYKFSNAMKDNSKYSEDWENSKEAKFVRSDIQTKLKEIREQLTFLENNLRERKRKANKSLSSTFLCFMWSCFEVFS